MENMILKKFNFHYIILLVTSLVTHGLLLLNDGVYWDGWLIYTNILEEKWDNLYQWFFESGSPISYYFHWILGHFPNVVFSYKLVAFISITFSAVLVYMICCEFEEINHTNGLFIALLSLTYPAYQVSVELVTLPYTFFYCLFLLACYLGIRSEKLDGIPHYNLRVCSLILFLLSFTINSLLVFYFGFLLLNILYNWNLQSFSLKQVPRFLLFRLDYVLLPFLFWGTMRTFFPAHGRYAEYIQFAESFSGIYVKVQVFIGHAIRDQLLIAVEYLLTYPVFVFLAILILKWIHSKVSPDAEDIISKRKISNPYRLLLFGLVLLGLGIFPYVAVGIVPSVHGWDTRHALLVGLPMAIIIIATIYIYFYDSIGSQSRIEISLMIFFLLPFSLSTISTYISWQARWVKDRSIMVNLSELEISDNVSVILIDDLFPAGVQERYRFYERTSMFKMVWENESTIGIERNRYSDERLKFLKELCYGTQYSDYYNLSNWDPSGCQAVLTIRHGSCQYNDIGLSLRYFFYKYFRNEKLTEFLGTVTDLHIEPTGASQDVRCPSP